MSITDRVLDALKSAIQLDLRVSALANSLADLSRDVREIDKRLVRIETLIELGIRGAGSPAPPAIEDGRR